MVEHSVKSLASVIVLPLILLSGIAVAVELRFAPAAGEKYVVHYEEDSDWNYPSKNMRGVLSKAFTIEWTIGDRDALLGQRTVRGKFTKVRYMARGIRRGREIHQSITWTRKGGYAPGSDTQDQRKSIDSEIQAGATIVFGDQLHPKPGST